jgi:SHAQKYF class myb-like DNA-binding protein
MEEESSTEDIDKHKKEEEEEEEVCCQTNNLPPSLETNNTLLSDRSASELAPLDYRPDTLNLPNTPSEDRNTLESNSMAKADNSSVLPCALLPKRTLESEEQNGASFASEVTLQVLLLPEIKSNPLCADVGDSDKHEAQQEESVSSSNDHDFNRGRLPMPVPVQSTLLLVSNPKHKRAATSSAKTNKTKSRKKSNESTGRWTAEEHREFLRGLQLHGREWKKVATLIPSRSSAQVRSHAQKYFVRLQKMQEEDPELLGELKSLGDEGTSTCSSSHVQHRVEDASIANMPLSVRLQAERILAQPETVQAEVTLTLERLRVRYRQLQEQLSRRQQSAAQNNEASTIEGAPDNESVGAGSIESLHHGELIALHVLQGGLASANESENENETKVSTTKINESTDPSADIQASKRRRLD